MSLFPTTVVYQPLFQITKEYELALQITSMSADQRHVRLIVGIDLNPETEHRAFLTYTNLLSLHLLRPIEASTLAVSNDFASGSLFSVVGEAKKACLWHFLVLFFASPTTEIKGTRSKGSNGGARCLNIAVIIMFVVT